MMPSLLFLAECVRSFYFLCFSFVKEGKRICQLEIFKPTERDKYRSDGAECPDKVHSVAVESADDGGNDKSRAEIRKGSAEENKTVFS